MGGRLSAAGQRLPILTSHTAVLLGRIQHRDHCRANRLGQTRPGTHNPQQPRIIGGHFGANCTGFCSARFENPRIPAGRRHRFESPILHSTGLHHLAPGRKPLQNRDFFMRGQCGRLPEDRSSVQRLFSRVRLRTVTHPLDWGRISPEVDGSARHFYSPSSIDRKRALRDVQATLCDPPGESHAHRQ